MALFALVIFLYVFLNQATKGYYQAKLAAWLSGGLVIVGLAFAFLWQAHSQVESVHSYPQAATQTRSTQVIARPLLEAEPAGTPPQPTKTKAPLPAKPVVTAPRLNEAVPEDGGSSGGVPE